LGNAISWLMWCWHFHFFSLGSRRKSKNIANSTQKNVSNSSFSEKLKILCRFPLRSNYVVGRWKENASNAQVKDDLNTQKNVIKQKLKFRK
jgi:hypothetical protein